MRVLVISAAGALGTTARYGMTVAAAKWLGTEFPSGTLAVNVIGCAIVAFLFESFLLGSTISMTARMAMTTGFCGGFTTYSSFNYEVLRLVEQGHTPRAAVYLLATLLLCAASGVAGLWGARVIAAT